MRQAPHQYEAQVVEDEQNFNIGKVSHITNISRILKIIKEHPTFQKS